MKKFVHLFLLLNSSFLLFSNALTDTILQGQLISVSNTIVSSGSVFELGVFSPGGTNSTTTTSYYVGVWYKSISVRTVVWVANREFPFTDIKVAITIAPDGNLVMVAGRISYKVSDVSSSGNTSAALLDSGNLVLTDRKSGNLLWQSFDYPLDTLLPGMKLGYDSRNEKTWSFSAWKSREDPDWGDFSLELDPQGTSQLFILKGSKKYWTSGEWNGRKFAMTPEMEPSSVLTYFVSNQNGSYFTYNLTDPNIACRMVMDESGQFKLLQWVGSADGWELLWAQPRQLCNVNAYCGAYGTCDNYTLSSCGCLHGFQPNSTENWNAGDLSGGCSRRTPLQCGYDIQVVNGLKDQFLPISNVRLPVNPEALQVRSAVECESACFSNCSCSAYAYNGDGCAIWSGDLLNVEQLTDDDPAGKDFYLKLAGTEFLSKGSISKKWKWIIPTIAGVSFTLLTALIFCLRRRKSIEKGENLLSFDLGTNIGPSNYAVNEAGSKGKTDGKKEVDLPLFSFASVSAATDNFSQANKLGEGGFGPVYKGKLLKGYEVAVKRLSRKSGQGLEELQNEAMLIAKLQHKNLVRLLGCCIDRDEKILIYEYMPNKSLDFFLFDPINYCTLNWESRVNIIEGIAQGLLYLHQYSRLRIIHRDLKASNILLDKDMNPKISDFGLARIFRGNGSQTTSRIVGTYGYMSPEYALEGLFSVKSDVFSFGVLLLEILSGKKNTGFYNTVSLNLLGYTWDLWKSDRGQEIKDPIIEDILSINMLLRYINIGLLCVQECADDRPDMSNVLSMLSNESMLLPSPKQPAFSTSRSLPDGNSSRRLQICSANGMTDSILEAR